MTLAEVLKKAEPNVANFILSDEDETYDITYFTYNDRDDLLVSNDEFEETFPLDGEIEIIEAGYFNLKSTSGKEYEMSVLVTFIF